MRKYHDDQPTAALTWNKCGAAMEKCHCSKLLHVVQRLGAVIDFKARSPAEIRLGLSYIASHRGSDPFVKNIALVGAKTVKSAQLHSRQGESESATQEKKECFEDSMQKFLDRLANQKLGTTEAADAAFQEVRAMVGLLDSSQNAVEVEWMAIISIYIGIADAVARGSCSN